MIMTNLILKLLSIENVDGKQILKFERKNQ